VVTVPASWGRTHVGKRLIAPGAGTGVCTAVAPVGPHHMGSHTPCQQPVEPAGRGQLELLGGKQHLSGRLRGAWAGA